MSTSHLTFGAEFEVILPAGFGHDQAADRLSAITGIDVVQGSRTRPVARGARVWRVVHDGSVMGNGYGAEFVSPILRGQEGLDEIATIARALASIGATVNVSCGFHVHVGGFRREIDFFKTLVKLYGRYQDSLDRLFPESRRNNQYCRSIRANASVDTARTVDEVILAATGTNGGRYFKLNLAAFSKHSTVEFRQHAGTVDAVKAVNWIKTCLRIVAAAEQGKTGITSVSPLSFSHLPVKARKVAEMVTRSIGASTQEILAGTTWQVISVRRQAAIAGLDLQVRREHGQDRFFAPTTGPVSTTEAPTTLAGLFSILDTPADEADFFHRRAAELNA